MALLANCSLSDMQSHDSWYFCANDGPTKEEWKEKIVTQITLLQKIHQRKESTRVDILRASEDTIRIRNDFLARPIIYIKIIRARNLAAKDIGGTSGKPICFALRRSDTCSVQS